MSYELIRANLNLYAVLRNLEELPKYDPKTAGQIKDWNISIQFSVINGPKGFLEFKNGKCFFYEGKRARASIKLIFISPAHFNKMMDKGRAPIIIRGFSKIKFLTKQFKDVTERLKYYLMSDENKLKDPEYMKINTILTLNTVVFSIKELALNDEICKINASNINRGTVLFEILPEGPSAYLNFKESEIRANKGKPEKPLAIMQFKDFKAANDIFNNISDPFTATAMGDIIIRGRISMIESINLIIDKIRKYIN